MMAPAGYTIVRAEASHLPHLAAIELAAARLLDGHAPPAVRLETTALATLARAASEGRLWVALSAGAPVGFALVAILPDGAPHLEEIDVDPLHGRRGVGTALVTAVCEWASLNAHDVLTLTTFRTPPFNMPLYARLGFVEVLPAALRPALSAVVGEETARGLAAGARVVMQYDSATAIRRATPDDRDALFHIWIHSARATHKFVSEADLQAFAPAVRDYLSSDAELWVLCASTGQQLGFMGLAGQSMESLFLSPDCLRRGFGSRLLSHAFRLRGQLTVDVNEQNRDAVAFYTARGFRIEGRSELDDNRRPYPLLHMRSGNSVTCGG